MLSTKEFEFVQNTIKNASAQQDDNEISAALDRLIGSIEEITADHLPVEDLPF